MKPQNYPSKGPSPPVSPPGLISPDGAPMPPMAAVPDAPQLQLGYEDTFPVINVRFQYPPTSIDKIRKVYLGTRNGEILDICRIVDLDMVSWERNLNSHLERIDRILGYLIVLPRNLQTKLQNYLSRVLAEQIPEVPVSIFTPSSFANETAAQTNGTDTKNIFPESFLEASSLPPGDFETTENNPQINIGIEDNLDAFKEGVEMSLNEADLFVKDIAYSWYRSRHLLIQLIKMKLKQLELIMGFLYPRISTTTLKKKEIQKEQEKQQRQMMMQARRGRGSLIEENAAFHSPISLAAIPPPLLVNSTDQFFNQTGRVDPGSSGPVGLDFKTVMLLRVRVMERGRNGAAALSSLIDLWEQRYGWREQIRKTKVDLDCRILLSLPSTPDFIKNLAGTLLTLMTGAPVSASVPDFKSGSYGHVNIIVPRPSRTFLPDKEVALSTGG